MTAAPAKPPQKKKQATSPKVWAEITALYETGDYAVAELAKRFGLAPDTLTKKFIKQGTRKGSKQAEIQARVAASVAAAAITDATVMAARIKETKEEHYKMASAIGRLTWNEVLQAKKDNKPVAIALNNLKALDAAMTILRKAREERYAVLGLDRPDALDPDEIPELIISELTAEQVQQLRDRDHTELDDATTNQDAAESAPSDELVSEGDDE